MTKTLDEPVRGVRTDDEGSMAWDTARTRWPVTVQKMIDDCEQTAKETEKNSAAHHEMKALSGKLGDLKRSIEEDGKLTRVVSRLCDVP